MFCSHPFSRFCLFVCAAGLFVVTRARVLQVPATEKGKELSPVASPPSPPGSLPASTSFLGSLQSHNSRLDPFFFIINDYVSQAIMDLETFSNLSD